MQSLIQILKVNELKSGISKTNGKPYEMQDAECMLLKETGEIDQVGVLQLPKDMRGESAPGVPKVQPGIYMGSFALRADMASRRINAVLVGLQPYAIKQPGKGAA